MFLKNEAGETHFFVWLNRAMNGAHRWKEFYKDFQDRFTVPEEAYELFLRERIAVDKADRVRGTSNAIVKISVSENFYKKTKKNKEKFSWLNEESVKDFLEEDKSFRESEKWIVSYLFRHPLDVVNFPAGLFEAVKKNQSAREKKSHLVLFVGFSFSDRSDASSLPGHAMPFQNKKK